MRAQQFELSTEEVDFSMEELSISTELVRQVSQQLVIVSAEELDFYGTGTLVLYEEARDCFCGRVRFLWKRHVTFSMRHALGDFQGTTPHSCAEQFHSYRAPLYL